MPSLFEQHALYQRAMAADLSRHLSSLNDVHATDVYFHRPLRSPLTPIREPDAPSVSVIASVLDSADLAALRRDIIEIAIAAVDGLEKDRLSVILTARPDSTSRTEGPERLASLGPFEVAASSKLALQLVAALLLGLIAALAMWAFAAEHVNASLGARLERRAESFGNSRPSPGAAPGGDY